MELQNNIQKISIKIQFYKKYLKTILKNSITKQ